MNSKLIAIIAVVAMCGAALVGVGYAYSASYSDDVETANVTVTYVKVTNTSGFTVGALTLDYDTVNDKDNNTKFTLASATGEDWSFFKSVDVAAAEENNKDATFATFHVGDVVISDDDGGAISRTNGKVLSISIAEAAGDVTYGGVTITMTETNTAGTYSVDAKYVFPVSGSEQTSVPYDGTIGNVTLSVSYDSETKVITVTGAAI